MTAFIGLVDRKPAYLGDFAEKGRPCLRVAYWNLKGQDIAVTTSALLALLVVAVYSSFTKFADGRIVPAEGEEK